jgi:SRSO17 transposase
MIERAVTAGIPFGWVTADEAYGDNGALRAYLEERGIAYVLAVARAHVSVHPGGQVPGGRPGCEAAEAGLAADELR